MCDSNGVGDVPTSLKGIKTMENIYQPVIEKIEAARAVVAKANIDQATAKTIWEAAPDIDEDIHAWAQYHKANDLALSAHMAYGEIDACTETLSLPLAKPETRYVITDGDLISPAGFYCDSGVYIRNDYWVETDRLPRHWDGKAYDMKKVAEQMAA